MSENDYNGWANHATWNVSLWVDNEEALYDMMLREWPTEPDRDAADAYRLARRLFPSGSTPDRVLLSNTSIDWVEIAEAWDEANGLDEPN